MLFRRRDHAAIEDGAITMTVRAWRRPQAKVGGAYRLHARGVIVVDELTRLGRNDLTKAHARASGYDSRDALLADLDGRGEPEDELTVISFRYEARADARNALAADDSLDDTELATLRTRLERMDARSSTGAWTLATLRLIEERPHEVSTTLAESLGRDRQAFKTDVRKLKRLGLTISHERGYELSPRGRALLAHIERATASEG